MLHIQSTLTRCTLQTSQSGPKKSEWFSPNCFENSHSAQEAV